MDYYKERLAAYLAKVRGPGPSPMNFVPRPRPTGDAVLAVIREYDTPGQGYGLPMWEDGTDWTEGAPSKTSRKNHHAMDGTLDFDGNLYFSDDLNTNPYRSVGKVDAETGLVTNVHVLRRRMPEMASAVHDLIADQKGTLWFGADGRLIALDPETLEWEAVTTPDGELVRAGGFHDKDGLGGVWGAVRGGAIRYDPNTRTATEYQNPIQKDKRGSAGTYGMAGDRDGNGWLSQYGFDVMVKHEHATGESYSVQLPQSPYAPAADLFVGDDRRIFDTMGGSLFHGRGHPWMAHHPQAGRRGAERRGLGAGLDERPPGEDRHRDARGDALSVPLSGRRLLPGGGRPGRDRLDRLHERRRGGAVRPAVGGVDLVRPAHGRHRIARAAGGDRRRPDAGRRTVMGIEQNGEARVPDRG